MYIARGTTPTHVFTIPINSDDLYSLKITYNQADRVVISKEWVAAKTMDNTLTEKLDIETAENNRLNAIVKVYSESQYVKQSNDGMTDYRTIVITTPEQQGRAWWTQ